MAGLSVLPFCECVTNGSEGWTGPLQIVCVYACGKALSICHIRVVFPCSGTLEKAHKRIVRAKKLLSGFKVNQIKKAEPMTKFVQDHRDKIDPVARRLGIKPEIPA